jgi:hypothetical protein
MDMIDTDDCAARVDWWLFGLFFCHLTFLFLTVEFKFEISTGFLEFNGQKCFEISSSFENSPNIQLTPSKCQST